MFGTIKTVTNRNNQYVLSCLEIPHALLYEKDFSGSVSIRFEMIFGKWTFELLTFTSLSGFEAIFTFL